MIIYRGDADSRNTRQIKRTVPQGDGLYSNLINGGNPLAPTQKKLFKLVQSHVFPGWPKTHFLSFSKCKRRAESFARTLKNHTLNLSNQNVWDAIVASINILSLKHIQSIKTGIDLYSFPEKDPSTFIVSPSNLLMPVLMHNYHMAKSTNSLRTFQILLIDVEMYLKAMKDEGATVNPNSIVLASKDKEVLVLPYDPMPAGIGHSALLHMSCISNIDFYYF